MMTYFIPGMSYGDVEHMLHEDRRWYLKRLMKQLKDEAKAMKGKKKGVPLKKPGGRKRGGRKR